MRRESVVRALWLLERFGEVVLLSMSGVDGRWDSGIVRASYCDCNETVNPPKDGMMLYERSG